MNRHESLFGERPAKKAGRMGLVTTTALALLAAGLIAPALWVGIYRFIEAPGTTLMLVRAGQGQRIDHRPVPLSRMSPHVVRAVIAAEDSRFCQHDGFDIEAIRTALQRNRPGRRLRGASTISQQTAKNVFLWPARTWLRKGFETYFTVLMEAVWPKRRIMEAYLNSAEFGEGVFGVEAAAQRFFNVPASRLSPMQAARLAAVLPAPQRYRADRPGPFVRRRAATLVQRARVVARDGLADCVLSPDRADGRRR